MSAAEQLDPIDMIVREATAVEVFGDAESAGFVRASWARVIWARGESAVQTYDDAGHADTPAPDRPYTSIGSPRRPHHMLVAAPLVAIMHRMWVDHVLSQAGTSVVVATLPDLPEPMGWAVWSGPVLHYVFVRGDCRKQRVASRLVQFTGCSAASHVTPSGRPLLKYLRRGG